MSDQPEGQLVGKLQREVDGKIYYMEGAAMLAEILLSGAIVASDEQKPPFVDMKVVNSILTKEASAKIEDQIGYSDATPEGYLDKLRTLVFPNVVELLQQSGEREGGVKISEYITPQIISTSETASVSRDNFYSESFNDLAMGVMLQKFPQLDNISGILGLPLNDNILDVKVSFPQISHLYHVVAEDLELDGVNIPDDILFNVLEEGVLAHEIGHAQFSSAVLDEIRDEVGVMFDEEPEYMQLIIGIIEDLDTQLKAPDYNSSKTAEQILDKYKDEMDDMDFRKLRVLISNIVINPALIDNPKTAALEIHSYLLDGLQPQLSNLAISLHQDIYGDKKRAPKMQYLPSRKLLEIIYGLKLVQKAKEIGSYFPEDLFEIIAPELEKNPLLIQALTLERVSTGFEHIAIRRSLLAHGIDPEQVEAFMKSYFLKPSLYFREYVEVLRIAKDRGISLDQIDDAVEFIRAQHTGKRAFYETFVDETQSPEKQSIVKKLRKIAPFFLVLGVGQPLPIEQLQKLQK